MASYVYPTNPLAGDDVPLPTPVRYSMEQNAASRASIVLHDLGKTYDSGLSVTTVIREASAAVKAAYITGFRAGYTAGVNSTPGVNIKPSSIVSQIPPKPTIQIAKEKDFLIRVADELSRARVKHPTAFHSVHEGLAIIWEEFEEFKAEVFKQSYAQRPIDLVTELVQTAAMCARTAEDTGLMAKIG